MLKTVIWLSKDGHFALSKVNIGMKTYYVKVVTSDNVDIEDVLNCIASDSHHYPSNSKIDAVELIPTMHWNAKEPNTVVLKTK